MDSGNALFLGIMFVALLAMAIWQIRERRAFNEYQERIREEDRRQGWPPDT